MAGAPEISLGLGADLSEEEHRRRLDEARRWAEEREQQYFRGYVVPKHAQKGLNKLLIGKGVPEEKGKKEEAPKEEVIPEGEREEETPTIKIREYPALKIGFYSERETPKEDYERAVRVQALLILENEIAVLGKGRAWDIYSKIQGEKVRNPDASLFNLIQEEIRELKTKPDEGIEAGLKSARNFLVETAKAHGIFEDVKGLIDEAQKEDWGQAKIEFRERINVASLEHTARGIEGWTTDFAGMIDEYVDAAMLNMDLAELRARGEGETQKAKDIKREIDLRGWGNPPTGLEKMAREYYEEVGEKEEEAIEIKRVVIDRDLSDEDREKFEIYERDILEACLNDMQKAVDLVGDNVNIYPYKEYLVDSTVDNLRRYVKEKREELVDINVQDKGLRVGKDLPDRAEYLFGRLEQIADLLEGNAAMLSGAGNVLVNYYDGWQMLEMSVRQLRKDVRSRENHKLFAGLRKEKLPDLLKEKLGKEEWELAKEIVSKQDQVFEILRGIAAAHRHKGRNVGIDIREILKGDYVVTENQAEFIEKVLASKKKYLRTSRSNGKEVDVVIEPRDPVEVIAGIRERDGAINELGEYFETDKKGARKVVIGEYLVITKEFVRSLSPGELRGKALWVDGVEWKLDGSRAADSLEDIKGELEDKIGSGDKIFLGEVHDVNKGDFRRVIGKTKAKQRVGLIEETPAAIDNLFVMAQTAQAIDEVKEKVAVMLNMGLEKDSLWERLRNDGADVDGLIEEFNLKWKEYREKGGSVLDRHIINMSRITLLYFLEGADLGWGFEYEEKEIGKGEKKTKVTKRVVSTGGTKAATDAGVLKWLMTQASSNWKDWTRAILPMDQVVAKQIIDHYPGWAPQKEGNKWRITFMGKPIEFTVPTTLDMSFLKTLKIPVETEGGIIKDRKAIELVCDEKRPLKMSEIPWLALVSDEARYRAFINERAMGLAAAPLTKPLDKQTIETFLGEEMITPRTIEAQEYLKRADLAFRDIQELKDTIRLISFVETLYLGWKENMFPSSYKPGEFDATEVRKGARRKKIALGRLAPRGDPSLGKKMGNDLDNYIKQLIPACRIFRTQQFRDEVKSWFG